MRQLSSSKIKKNSGFTFVEILIGVVVTLLLIQLVGGIASDYIHKYRIFQNADALAEVPRAVQRRNSHDGFVYSLWDENGTRGTTGSTIVWEEADFSELLSNFLVGRDHPGCGAGVDGWNPSNTGGSPDAGDPTGMESSALVKCNHLRGALPYRVKLSAVTTEDTATGAVEKFAMYLNMEDAHFGQKNEPDNNILNFTQLRNALTSSMSDSLHGAPNVSFVQINDLGDLTDDDPLTTSECEDRLMIGAECSFLVELDFNGLSNGMFKRVDNNNFFLDDVTFGQSIAGGRQRCAYWEEGAGTGDWTATEVDCAIKAGVNDDEIVVVVDGLQAKELYITDEDASGGVPFRFICDLYTEGTVDEELWSLAEEGTPCGMYSDGNVIQLLTETAHIENLLAEKIVSRSIHAAATTLYSTGAGDIVLTVYDATHTATMFTVTNEGNTVIGGLLDVEGDATFNSDAEVIGDFAADKDAMFRMSQNGRVTMGSTLGAQVVMERPDATTFRIHSNGVDFEILSGVNNQGLTMEDDGAGNLEIRLDAERGVIADNGTTIHNSISTLSGEEYDPTNGVRTDAEKLRSALVTADMAKYLDDTSSNIQIVGIDRVEGEFTTLTKPDCLAFTDDSNYSSAEANPYRQLIDSGAFSSVSGEDLARLVLLPMYFKTYNAAFGDNQIFAQHASHSSATSWEIYLYLSGEGAFSTGAREDGAGGSLAMTLCDYSSINFSRQSF